MVLLSLQVVHLHTQLGWLWLVIGEVLQRKSKTKQSSHLRLSIKKVQETLQLLQSTVLGNSAFLPAPPREVLQSLP